jgi:hypothetical protein
VDGAPFVTIYAGGELRGCFGSAEGGPRERLTRAFLRAVDDSRYGVVRPEERAHLAAVISYVDGYRVVDPEEIATQVEAGREGLGVVAEGRIRAMLLPHTTRDLRASPRALLGHLARKAGLRDFRATTVFAFGTDDVVVRSEATSASRGRDPSARAAAWLARLVDADGAVAFAIDARQRRRIATGLMHHGRAAVVVRALSGRTRHARVVGRARAWLRATIDRAIHGGSVAGWPEDRAMQAGTLALAHAAGLDFARELLDLAGDEKVVASPWHAAQVVAALGHDAPTTLFRACVCDLRRRPWAPWTVLAARARGDEAVVREASRALVASLRAGSPNEGGCSTTEVPETALTALVVEALDGIDDADARAAVRRGRRFLRRLQWLGEAVPANLDPKLADGAFPISPVVDLMRCDVVAHALLALGRLDQRRV